MLSELEQIRLEVPDPGVVIELARMGRLDLLFFSAQDVHLVLPDTVIFETTHYFDNDIAFRVKDFLSKNTHRLSIRTTAFTEFIQWCEKTLSSIFPEDMSLTSIYSVLDDIVNQTSNERVIILVTNLWIDRNHVEPKLKSVMIGLSQYLARLETQIQKTPPYLPTECPINEISLKIMPQSFLKVEPSAGTKNLSILVAEVEPIRILSKLCWSDPIQLIRDKNFSIFITDMVIEQLRSAGHDGDDSLALEFIEKHLSTDLFQFRLIETGVLANTSKLRKLGVDPIELSIKLVLQNYCEEHPDGFAFLLLGERGIANKTLLLPDQFAVLTISGLVHYLAACGLIEGNQD